MNNANKINNKKKNVAVLIISMLILVLLIGMVGMAYARFVAKTNGTVSAKVANVICNMEVTASATNDITVVNPYCIVTVKNFEIEQDQQGNDVTKVTEADVSFSIEVKPKEIPNQATFTLPEYYWYEIATPQTTTGNLLATSVPLIGQTLTNTSAQTKYYKVVFKNTGDQDLTGYVDFEIKAVQASN